MTTLPIRDIYLYKHGIAFFIRKGATEARELSLTFRPSDMNDVLKSLTLVDLAGGKVEGVFYPTPVSREERLADSTLALSDRASFLDLVRDLRGRNVLMTVMEGDKQRSVVGRMIGIESESKGVERISLLSNEGQVRLYALSDVRALKVSDAQAERDLLHFLDKSTAEENRRVVRVHLSEGQHDLVVSYTAPSPSWRVSYRLLLSGDQNEGTAELQGWGVFDNTLDEDLQDVMLTLVAGEPMAVDYDLVRAPLAPKIARMGDAPTLTVSPYTPARTEDKRELFLYRVLAPMSVKRGESALVPIIAAKVAYQRELLFSPQTHYRHPVTALRFDNTSGLTLEEGPVTVLGGVAYYGDALLPFTSHGHQVYLPYAIEKGMVVEHATQEKRVFARLAFSKGTMILNEYHLTEHTYTIENQSGREATLVLEVPNDKRDIPHLELFDTPPPNEITPDVWRWRVPLPSRGISQWRYNTRYLVKTEVSADSLPYERLMQYLDGRMLEGHVQALVRDLVQVNDGIKQQLARKESLLEQESRLYAQQSDWRETLAVLRDTPEEAAFRLRLLTQLEETNQRMNALRREVRACDTRVASGQKRILDLLEQLSAT